MYIDVFFLFCFICFVNVILLLTKWSIYLHVSLVTPVTLFVCFSSQFSLTFGVSEICERLGESFGSNAQLLPAMLRCRQRKV